LSILCKSAGDPGQRRDAPRKLHPNLMKAIRLGRGGMARSLSKPANTRIVVRKMLARDRRVDGKDGVPVNRIMAAFDISAAIRAELGLKQFAIHVHYDPTIQFHSLYTANCLMLPQF
jgi:hypothetical protein